MSLFAKSLSSLALAFAVSLSSAGRNVIKDIYGNSYVVTSDSTLELSYCVFHDEGYVTFPDSVIHDGRSYAVTSVAAWPCSFSGFTAVSLPRTLVRVAPGVFDGCSALHYVAAPCAVHADLLAAGLDSSVVLSDRPCYSSDIVRAVPDFPGGVRALLHFFDTHVTWPYEEVESDWQGRVVMAFDVDVDGSFSGFEVCCSMSRPFDDEVVRVLRMMPRCTPAVKDGKVVKMRVRLPFVFRVR